ncbi:TRAP transporter substrate-binding protein [Chromohalobacter nigrandesensis]|uniref:TRAP transporter substrate-binding protein n=1 Tax=Chromohalobacter nigrandesensis TaxID=119863 RepID=UPI001FF25AC9|nr:TRAP transporter substrate-binding protein [Chromohalobacter nigrandesensis]MCK0745233.1 TRAP transporter substrate-binding protein [Chromohalobacter nigrandesensis]
MKICSLTARHLPFAALALGSALLSFSVPGEAKELKLGLITPPQHVWTKAAHEFAERVESESDGDLSVALFPAGQLGDEPAMFAQMQSGLLDMGIMTAAITSQREPSVNGWFTPFLFDSVEDAIQAAHTPAAEQMLDNLEDKGLHAFGYTFAGMRHILMRDHAVTSLDDLDHQKIRIIPISAMQTWWRATDAVPTPIQLPDVYQGLQNKMIDGVGIDLDALVGSGFDEVAQHLTLTNHMAFPAIAMVSTTTWDTLSENERKVVNQAMHEALDWANQAQIDAEADNLAYLEEHIDVRHLDDAKAQFAKANAAFDDKFSVLPLISQFQQQVADQHAEQ